MEQRITRAKARIAAANVPFEAPGPVERAERLGCRRRDDLPRLQRGLHHQRGRAERARAAVRGSHPACAAAAAAVPDRARDHGAARRCCCCSTRARPPGSMPTAHLVLLEDQDRSLLGPQADRRRSCADRQGDAASPAGPLPGAGGDRGAARARGARRGHRLGSRSICSMARSSACSPRRSSRSIARSRSPRCAGRPPRSP